MALTTTDMKGHSKLRERIVHALDRCQEEQWLDFKESQPWGNLQWRLLKTIMAMANLRDGGLIVVGVSERGDIWELTGISPNDRSTYDYDIIIDQVSKYASPEISLDIVVHRHDDSKEYVAINVHQFTEMPVVCKKNGPDGLTPRVTIAAGDIFVRPPGKPRTETVKEASRLHDLLELAAENRARRMLEVAHRVGLVPVALNETQFEEESASIIEIPVPVKNCPHWLVTIRPDQYERERIPSRSACLKYVEKARVRLRGWDFPYVSNREDDHGQGSSWIASWCQFMGSIEYWRFFQSGQFIHYSGVREVTEGPWREKLQGSARSHLRHMKDVDWDAVPGFISITNLLYNVTEFFEFAARLAQAGVYESGVSVRLELHGIKGFMLTTELNRMWREYCVAHENDLIKTWTIASDRLIAGSAEFALAATGWFLESFGWMNPHLDGLQKEQLKFLQSAT
jgi:hypothetical protein